MKTVSFQSNGLRIAANLYYPANPTQTNQPLQAIVVSHPGTGVKEQTAGLYAKQLSEAGFITLTFDAAYQGESEGTPRNLEDPEQRIEDIKSAVSWLTTLDDVDANKIGVLGICASGGYALAAAATDHRIKAVATVSGVDIGRQFRLGSDGQQSPAVIQQLLDAVAADRTSQAKGNAPGVFPIFPENETQAKSMGEHGFEGYEYYCTNRGQHPRSAKTLTWSSVDRVIGYDTFSLVDLIAPRPLLQIAGTRAETLWMAKEVHERAREPKELFLIEGATHVALYDKAAFVTPAIAKLEAFFFSTLN